jgi:ribonuclease P/MRP protein subunit RPP1
VRSYDILAVEPTSEKLFQQACSAPLEVDIIVLSQADRQGFSLRVPMIKMALERGIFFELCYSAALSGRIKDQPPSSFRDTD